MAALVVFACVVVGCVVLFKVLPTGFVPQEDQGYLFVAYFSARCGEYRSDGDVGSQGVATMRENPAVA